MRHILVTGALALFALGTARATPSQSRPDWAAAEAELIRHFQAIVKLDTTDPPGGERPVVDYLKSVLKGDGIEFQEFALEPNRPNLVARLKGNGRKRPLLSVRSLRRKTAMEFESN